MALFSSLYAVITNKISLPDVYLNGISTSLFFGYKPVCVFISIFFINIYVCVTTYIIYRSFEKTQATDMLFFLLFLTACLCDTSRLLIPLLNISESFSNIVIKIGTVSLFARLLAPMALFGSTVLSTEDFVQSTDYNCLILLIAAMFFAQFLPVNTAVILPNFCVSYGYLKAIRYLSFILCFVSFLTILIQNIKNEYKMIMPVGFAMICIAYSILFNSYSIFSTVSGALLLGFGTYMYLSEVHKHYLWLD